MESMPPPHDVGAAVAGVDVTRKLLTTCYELTRVSCASEVLRGCYSDATMKLLPWNLVCTLRWDGQTDRQISRHQTLDLLSPLWKRKGNKIVRPSTDGRCHFKQESLALASMARDGPPASSTAAAMCGKVGSEFET